MGLAASSPFSCGRLLGLLAAAEFLCCILSSALRLLSAAFLVWRVQSRMFSGGAAAVDVVVLSFCPVSLCVSPSSVLVGWPTCLLAHVHTVPAAFTPGGVGRRPIERWCDAAERGPRASVLSFSSFFGCTHLCTCLPFAFSFFLFLEPRV